MANRIEKGTMIYKLLDRVLSGKVLEQLDEEQREELLDQVNLVRRMIAEQRAPHVTVLGDQGRSLPGLVKSILGESAEGDLTVKEKLGRERWYTYPGQSGALRLLDLRTAPEDEVALEALSREQSDIVLLTWSPGEDHLIEQLEDVVRTIQGAWAETPTIVAAICEPEDGVFRPGEAERQLRRALVDSTVPNESFSVVLRDEERYFVETLVERAPMQVRIRLAHLTWARAAKREVAESIIKAASGITATIATIPLPVADTVPITAMQVVMVAAIAHLSGREFNVRTVGEFAAALGINVGVGYAAREFLRAFAQLIPVAGSVLSAGIASSATYAVGRAAMAYFIGEERTY